MTALALSYWRTLTPDDRANWKREMSRYRDSQRQRGDRSIGVIYLNERAVRINQLPEELRDTAGLINETRRAIRERRTA